MFQIKQSKTGPGHGNWPEAFWIAPLRKWVSGGTCEAVIPKRTICPKASVGPADSWQPGGIAPHCCVSLSHRGDHATCNVECAEKECAADPGMKWVPLNYSHNPYTCCRINNSASYSKEHATDSLPVVKTSNFSGFSSSGSIYSINVTSGALAVLHSFPNLTTAAAACSRVPGEKIRAIALHGGKLNLAEFDFKAHGQLQFTDLSEIGFLRPTYSEMELGLDWYLQSGFNGSNDFLAGPDELGFVHVLEYESKHFSDLFEYSQGARLAFSNSAFDPVHRQLWIQTTFDVSSRYSSSSTTANGQDLYAIYLKQYDVGTGSLLNVVKDSSSAQIIVSVDGGLYTIGRCTNSTGSSHCLWFLDPSAEIPRLKQNTTLSTRWTEVMASAFLTSGNLVHIVVREGSQDSTAHGQTTPALSCTKKGVCWRTADAATFAGDGWAIATIDLFAGEVLGTVPLVFSPRFDRQSKLLC